MFTWIPIHEETAKRLLEFKDRSHELVDILARMKAEGLKTTKIADQGKDGSEFQLKEIDPFTFLANFNRNIRDDNRQALWKALKDEWQLKSDVPEDFDGLPLADARNSWLMPYAKDRSPEHVPLLWEFFAHIMTASPEALGAGLMQRCLNLPHVGLAMLTMGMFWSCPKKWIATDGKNLGFAETKGVTEKPKTATDYLSWLPKIRRVIGGDGVDFSRQAHLWAIGGGVDSYGYPFDKLFANVDPGPILDLFAEVIEKLRQSPGFKPELLVPTLRREPALCISYGDWRVFAYGFRGGSSFDLALPASYPATPECVAREVFAKEIRGEKTGLYTVRNTGVFDPAKPWDDFIAYLPRIVEAFAGQRSSSYRRWSAPDVLELMTDLEARERILKNGISAVEIDTPPITSRRYWLMAPGRGAEFWESWLEHGIASIGWSEIGDLSQYLSKDDMRDALQEKFPAKDQAGAAFMLWNFRHEMKEGDVVFAKMGVSEVFGWGVVREGFTYNAAQANQPNTIFVDWEEKKAMKLPGGRLLPQKTMTEITEDKELLDILGEEYPNAPGIKPPGGGIIAPPLPDLEPYSMDNALSELFMSRESLTHILEQLKRKKNIILQGAPGVGKTFIAKRLAWLQMGEKDEAAVEMVQFHQSYTYEDFVQGLRPTKDGHFAVKDGVFYRLCRKALANPQQDYFLVIDEINRGNLSKILGELMMLIETDKRGEALTLAYSEEPFTVPPNLYLIGTMNTADRSLSLVDYALRRRFAFLTLDPGFAENTFAVHLEKQGITLAHVSHIRSMMEALNAEIEKDETNLGRGYRIGHSFFTPVIPVADFNKWFSAIVRYEILPLIEEYWIDDPKMIARFRIELMENLL